MTLTPSEMRRILALPPVEGGFVLPKLMWVAVVKRKRKRKAKPAEE